MAQHTADAAVPDLRVEPGDEHADFPGAPLAPEEAAAAARRSVLLVGGCGLRAYTPTLWHVRQRQREGEQKQERDSLRSRSKEGRPGSRKHRRWTRSQELVGSLRRAMAACGEDHGDADVAAIADQLGPDQRPSAFYRLLEREGPSGALDAWAAAESARRPRSRPRPTKSEAQVAEEDGRTVRQVFGENWQYIHGSDAAKDLLLELEGMATCAFGSMPPNIIDADSKGGGADKALQEWWVHWDGSAMKTKSGTPPADEMAILGLAPAQRKCVHQLARLLGLHSESRAAVEWADDIDGGDGKVLTMRPPRRPCATKGAWAAPLSLSRILAVA